MPVAATYATSTAQLASAARVRSDTRGDAAPALVVTLLRCGPPMDNRETLAHSGASVAASQPRLGHGPA
jgi:hypothetical protein